MATRVAPFAGAWIEMRRIFDSSVSASVAPFAGAWIEIMTDIYLLHTLLSLPSRERGLKYFKGTATAAYDSSLPSRERGLKLGLPRLHSRRDPCRSLRGSVD